jgi:hypothetical protein
MEALRKRKHLVLLLTLVVMLALQPLSHGPRVGVILGDAVGTLVLLAIFLVVFQGRRQRAVALAATATVIGSNWGTYFLRGDALVVSEVLFHGTVVVFLAFAVVGILKGIFTQRVIRSDDVIGGLCGYLLAAIAWGNMYAFLEEVAPGSFSAQPAFAWQLAHRQPKRFLFNFYSFVNLASLGSSALTPVNPIASWLVALEAVFGQFYVAVVVGLMIGLKLAQATQGGQSKTE